MCIRDRYYSDSKRKEKTKAEIVRCSAAGCRQDRNAQLKGGCIGPCIRPGPAQSCSAPDDDDSENAPFCNDHSDDDD